MYGPVFLYRGRVMVPYSKPYLTIQEQLSLLRGRGLDISDELRAEAALQRIGYYRLSGYWYPLRKSIPIIDPMTGREFTLQAKVWRPAALMDGCRALGFWQAVALHGGHAGRGS